MPLGDRFGDLISESAARDVLGTSGESRELLACAFGIAEHGRPQSLRRTSKGAALPEAMMPQVRSSPLVGRCGRTAPKSVPACPYLIFAAGQQPPGPDGFPAGRLRHRPSDQ